MKICTTSMSMDISRAKDKEKEKERKARMMMAKEENQETAKVSPTMSNLRSHRLLPYRTNSSNKLIALLQHQALVMVSLHLQRQNQHVWMLWQSPMKSKLRTIDALVEEDKTNVMKWHGWTGRKPRDFLSWLEIFLRFVQVYNDDQHQCPEKLVCSKARHHGSHWQKAHHCFHVDALRRQVYHLILNALKRQRMLFSFHIIQPDPACENGYAFHTENSAPPTVCILDLGCTRAMGSRRAVEAFCSYVDSHPNSGLWSEIQPTSSRFFFANS